MELLQRLVNRDQSALKELYQDLGAKVYNTAISYVQDSSEAEEITQDVFLEVYKSAAQFKGKSSVSTWVYRITVNKSLDLLKYKKRSRRFANLFSLSETKIDLPHFDHPGILLENKDEARVLFEQIYLLPNQQKTAFILAYVEELPRGEIAEIMDLKLKAVESLLHRAKKNLREKLKKD